MGTRSAVDLLVAAGELAGEEIAGVAPSGDLVPSPVTVDARGKLVQD
jgi:hypothetical protein